MILIFVIIFVLTLVRYISVAIPQKSFDEKKYINTIGENYPLYTILVPMFMERVFDIQRCRENILKTLYPNFEVIYLCEEVDRLAIKYLSRSVDGIKERVVIIPQLPPLTKPKACNYGLEFANGRYVTIYDIEDIPHVMQLHVAHSIFSSTQNICVQFPLEFIYDGTILGAWQHIDYAVWFGKLLPFCLNAISFVPLGGTSNHFVTAELRKSGGWDAYNVTEDAELGVRIGIDGGKMLFVNGFSTQEVVVKNITNLVKQRTRWVKGHILTFFQYIPLVTKLKKLYSFFWIFYLLFSNVFICLSFLLTYFCKFEVAMGIKILVISNIFLFFMLPVWYCIFLKNIKCKWWECVFTYNVYLIFYIIPIIRAVVECVMFPNFWYKTKR